MWSYHIPFHCLHLSAGVHACGCVVHKSWLIQMQFSAAPHTNRLLFCQARTLFCFHVFFLLRLPFVIRDRECVYVCVFVIVCAFHSWPPRGAIMTFARHASPASVSITAQEIKLQATRHDGQWLSWLDTQHWVSIFLRQSIVDRFRWHFLKLNHLATWQIRDVDCRTDKQQNWWCPKTPAVPLSLSLSLFRPL